MQRSTISRPKAGLVGKLPAYPAFILPIWTGCLFHLSFPPVHEGQLRNQQFFEYLKEDIRCPELVKQVVEKLMINR